MLRWERFHRGATGLGSDSPIPATPTVRLGPSPCPETCGPARLWGMDARSILKSKGNAVVTIDSGATIEQAIGLLAEHGLGALVVSGDGQAIDGILSERDVARGLASEGTAVMEQAVSQHMTAEVQTCALGDTVAELMTLMTDQRIRHLPVLIDGGLGGIVSIGDVVKLRVAELEIEAQQMVEYLRGR
jgi:CBS domain-containing protein